MTQRGIDFEPRTNVFGVELLALQDGIADRPVTVEEFLPFPFPKRGFVP